jgi:hypothetical protein
MSKRVLGLIAASALLVAGCGGGTPTSSAPLHPTAQACKVFSGWYQAHRSDLIAGAYSPVLKQAAAQAHSAKLRLALDRVRVADGIAAQTSGSVQATVKKQAQTLALAVVKYCKSAGSNS